MNDSDKRRILTNSALVIGTNILEKVLFFIINVIIARYLDIIQYGEYTTALSYATFFSIFTSIGINQALIRAILLENKYEKEHFANTLILKTILAILVYVIMVFSLKFTSYSENTIYLALILGIVRIGNEYLLAFYALYDAKERFIVPVIFSTWFAITFFFSTILVIMLKGNYFHFAYIRAIIVVLFLIIVLAHTLRTYKLKCKIHTLKKFIKRAIPFMLTIIFNNIITRTNIIILSLMHGTIFSGVFNNGYIFLQSLFFIPVNIERVLLPYLYKNYYEGKKDKFQFAFDVYSKFLSSISFYLLIIIFLFADDIIITIFGKKYYDSISVLKILCFGIPTLFSVASTVITALDKQKIITIFLGIGTVVNILFNFIFIYFFKSEGAAIATVITLLLTFLLLHIYLFTKGFIKLFASFKIYIILIFTTIGIFILYFYLLQTFMFIYSYIIVSLIYLAIIFNWIINKNDIRILKEALSKK